MGNTKPSDLIDEWIKAEGFTTWAQDHDAVVRNLKKWMDRHTSGQGAEAHMACNLDMLKGVISEMREVGERGSKKWRILAWADRLEMNLPSMFDVPAPKASYCKGCVAYQNSYEWCKRPGGHGKCLRSHAAQSADYFRSQGLEDLYEPESVQSAPSEEDALVAIERAYDEVSALCKGKRWTMCIPAQRDTDSDLVIGDALLKARDTITALRALGQKCRANF